jgi:hypothetical protein
LCYAHATQNQNHLNKPDSIEFQQRWRAVKSSWNPQVAQQQFEQLCDRFAKRYSSFIAELRKKRQHNLAYPEAGSRRSALSPGGSFTTRAMKKRAAETASGGSQYCSAEK